MSSRSTATGTFVQGVVLVVSFLVSEVAHPCFAFSHLVDCWIRILISIRTLPWILQGFSSREMKNFFCNDEKNRFSFFSVHEEGSQMRV
jgi:hypothetical protein